jgi:hypothetical protein
MNDDSITEITGNTVNNEPQTLSDTEIAASEEIDAEKEEKYKKAVKFMESLKCMTACKDKVKMYKSVAEQFAALLGYKDSEILMKKCKRSAKRVKEEIKKNIYERAQFHQNKAKSAADYKAAAAEFRRAKGYLDAEELAAKCDKLSVSIEKRGAQKVFVKWGLVILAVFLLIFGIATPYTKYFAASLSMKTGSYHFASVLYEKLGTYKDSEEKLTECNYQNGFIQEEKGNYKAAEAIFAKLNDYKDSADKEAALEKQVIGDSQAGDTVTVGGLKWIIIDKTDKQAFLLSKKAVPGKAYHDKLETVTWENASLRNFLNSEYLTKTFSAQEQKNINLSSVINDDNALFGTDGGNKTEDYIFILSMEEAKKYASLLPAVKSEIWLRSPGSTAQNAAFLSANGAVMDYGYAVDSDQIAVLPSMWYNYGDSE